MEGGMRGGVGDGDVNHAQAMELISFSRLPLPLDEVIDIWSISILGSVWPIPTLNAEALNLLRLA